MTGVPDKSGAEVVGGLTGFPIRSVEAGVGKGPIGIPVKSVRAGVVGGLTTVLVGAVVVVGWLTGVPDKSVGAGVVGGHICVHYSTPVFYPWGLCTCYVCSYETLHVLCHHYIV